MNIQLQYEKNGIKQIVNFDLESTCNMPEFETYYRLRESNPKISKEKWHKKFDKDLCLHLELAYGILKEEENYDKSKI